MKNYLLKPVGKEELQQALDLVWQVFLEFEAPIYSEEGVADFKRFIEPGFFGGILKKGEVHVWAVYDGNRVIGVVSAAKPGRISLLFVDSAYHKKGIATALAGVAIDFMANAWGCQKVTVNSSPYAIGFYEKIGFKATGAEKTVNGIRFTPMVIDAAHK